MPRFIFQAYDPASRNHKETYQFHSQDGGCQDAASLVLENPPTILHGFKTINVQAS